MGTSDATGSRLSTEIQKLFRTERMAKEREIEELTQVARARGREDDRELFSVKRFTEADLRTGS